mgnify:CR=1 FL=1
MIVPICETWLLLVTANDPLMMLPGPVQASGSVNETVGVGVNWLTVTVTVKVQACDILFDASFAVHETVVTPTGKLDPEAGVQEVVTPEQLSEAVGAG